MNERNAFDALQRATAHYGKKYCADNRNWISTTNYTVCLAAERDGVITAEEYEAIRVAEGEHFYFAGD